MIINNISRYNNSIGNLRLFLRANPWQISHKVNFKQYATNNQPARPILAIRREDASIWERRAPLAPHHVEKLIKKGARVLIQPSNRRAYPIQSYVRAGAEECEDISESPVIVGVKQVPREQLMPDKTYCFFSHTIKAQEANMGLLDAVLDRRIRLIDYECLKDENGVRKVAFGKFAGYAGMINILHGIGLRLLALGHHTPFMHIGPAHNYRNVGAAKQAVRDAGYEIALGKMPQSIGPLTFVFTGTGNVSQGAQEVFSELPIEYVDAKYLREVSEKGSLNKIYGAVVTRADHLIRKNNIGQQNNGKSTSFDMDEYNEFPERYYSNFSQTIAPYTSVIMNGVFWEEKYPRLLTKPDAKKLQLPAASVINQKNSNGFTSESNNKNNDINNNNNNTNNKDNVLQKRKALELLQKSIGSPNLPHRLIAICDISADPSGSIEFMDRCSEIDKPFYLYDANENSTTEDLSQNGILICSIDNMPTQLPLESTDMFGNLLLPYISEIMQSDATRSVEEENYSPVVDRAIIASNGKLRPDFEKIQELREQRRSVSSNRPEGSKSILVLGAGHVSGPLVQHLCSDPKYQVTVVGLTDQEIEKLQSLCNIENNNLNSLIADVTQHSSQETLRNLISDSDLVVSLLPYQLHPLVAKQCIKLRRNMVTTSYLSEELKQLQHEALESGVTILNEVGLDPGIDHLLAKRTIDEVSKRGGKITSFKSYCCGLPTPEFAENPLGYKYGWNPRGAFSVVLNEAKWLEDSQILEAKSGKLMDFAKDVDFLKGFTLEAFPNRDSLAYQKLYNLPDAQTIIRGTLRYKGFSDTINSLRDLGLIDTTAHPLLQPGNGSDITWPQWLAANCGHPGNISLANLKMVLEQRFSQRNGGKLKTYSDLGLLDDQTPLDKFGSPFESVREWIIKRYPFGEGENDLVIMRIMFDIDLPDGNQEERSLSMVVYGDVPTGGFSAMSKTVGYTAAIASKMVVEGEIQSKGMLVPLSPEIYDPILKRLEKYGIVAREYI